MSKPFRVTSSSSSCKQLIYIYGKSFGDDRPHGLLLAPWSVGMVEWLRGLPHQVQGVYTHKYAHIQSCKLIGRSTCQANVTVSSHPLCVLSVQVRTDAFRIQQINYFST